MVYLTRLSSEILDLEPESIGSFIYDNTGFTAETARQGEQTDEKILIGNLFSECIGEIAMGYSIDRERMKADIDIFLAN